MNDSEWLASKRGKGYTSDNSNLFRASMGRTSTRRPIRR
jgi:hypothetical protein